MNRHDDMEMRTLGGLAVLIVVFALVGGLPVPSLAQHSDDWDVEGDGERRQKIVRRYKNLLEQNPTKGVIFKKLVEYVGKSGGLDRLISEYEKRVEQKPEAANLRLVLGHLLTAKNEREKALIQYEKAVELAPKNPVSWMSRGMVHSELQHREKAAADFEKALEYVDTRSRKQKLLRKLADLAFEQHAWDRAETYYDKLIELDDRNEYLRMEYAQVLVQHRRYQKAVEQYEKLLELAGGNPKSRATTLRDLGDLYEKMGKDKKAVATYRKAMGLMRASNWLHEALRKRVIEVYRKNDRLSELLDEYEKKWSSPGYEHSMLLGRLSDDVGREEEALKYFRRASRLRGGATNAREHIIEIYRRRGEDKKVVEQYKRLIQIAPHDHRFQFELVRLYMRQGQREKAVEMLEHIERRFRGQPEVYMTLADTYMRYSLEDEALAMYKQLVEMEPDNQSYIMSLGEAYYRSGKIEKAVETWKRLLDSSLEKPDAHARLGQVFRGHGMIERGVRNYRKAVELRPDDISIRRGLASTYEQARRWDKAIEVWRYIMEHTDKPETRAEARGRIIGIYEQQHRLRSKLAEFREKFNSEPPDIEAGHFLAEGHLELNNFEKAEATYRKLVDADGTENKEDIEALEALERIYRQTGELEKAVGVLRRLAKLRPVRQREYYHQIATLSLKLYEDEQAVRYAALAVEKNPEDAEAHARLGEVYRKMHRLEAAAEEYRRAVRLDPRAHRYKMELAEILLEIGDRKKAEQLYREVARKARDDSLVLKSARRAIDLAERGGRLRKLESEFSELAFRGENSSVYRKVMLELYERMVTPLMLAMRYGVGGERVIIQEELDAIASRASPILMSALSGADVGQRALAVRLLGGLRDEGAALRLARMAADSEESLRSLAAISVAEIGSSRAAGPLIQALDDSDPKLRELATWALGYVGGKKARKALIDQLQKGQNWSQRALAALGLGRIGGEEAANALREVLATVPPGESNDGVMVAIAASLGQVGGQESIEALVSAMRRSPEDVRFVAAAGLAQIDRREAVRALLELRWGDRSVLRAPAMQGLAKVASRLERDRADAEKVQLRTRFETLMDDAAHIQERQHEIEVPGLIEDRKRSARLAGEVRTDLFFERYGELVAEIASKKLSSTGDEQVSPAVVLEDLWRAGRLRLGMLAPRSASGRRVYREALSGLEEVIQGLVQSDRDEVAAPALGLMSRIGPSGASSAAHNQLSSESPAVRAAAMRVIGESGSGTDALAPLEKGLEDGSFEVRRAACAALADLAASGALGSAAEGQIIELLTGALDDEYTSVRVSAVRALGRVGGEAAAAALVSRLESLETPLKIEALSALAEMDAERAKRTVESYRDHSDFRLRRAVEANDSGE